MKRLSQVPEFQNLTDAPGVVYPDIGESGETYDIDFRTLPSPKTYRLSGPVFSLRAPSGRIADSESGEAYEAEVEATHANEDPEAPTVLPSASMCYIQFP